MHGLLLFCALQRVMRFRRHSGCRDMSNEELGGIRFSSPAPSLPNSGYFCLEASRAHSLSSVKEMQTLFYSKPQQFKLKFQPKVLNGYPREKEYWIYLVKSFWYFSFDAASLLGLSHLGLGLIFKQTLRLTFKQVLVLIIMLHGGRGHNYRAGGKCILMWLFRTSL